MLVAKDRSVMIELLSAPAHSTLLEVVEDIIIRFENLVVTSFYRPTDEGVHGTWPCRGLDIRGRVYTFPEHVVSRVKERWVYDPERPAYHCAKLYGESYGGHIHIQVHDRTVVR